MDSGYNAFLHSFHDATHFFFNELRIVDRSGVWMIQYQMKLKTSRTMLKECIFLHVKSTETRFTERCIHLEGMYLIEQS